MSADPDGTSVDRAAALQLVAAAGLLVAAVVHFAVVDIHLREWMPTGLFFLGLGLVQTVLAAAALLVRRAWLYRVIAVVCLVVIALWVQSRTVGVPFGPDAWEPEAVGQADLISTIAEAVTVLAVVALGAGPTVLEGWLDRPLSLIGQALVLVGAVALVAWFVGTGFDAARDDAAAQERTDRLEELRRRIAPGRPTPGGPPQSPDAPGH